MLHDMWLIGTIPWSFTTAAYIIWRPIRTERTTIWLWMMLGLCAHISAPSLGKMWVWSWYDECRAVRGSHKGGAAMETPSGPWTLKGCLHRWPLDRPDPKISLDQVESICTYIYICIYVFIEMYIYIYMCVCRLYLYIYILQIHRLECIGCHWVFSPAVSKAIIQPPMLQGQGKHGGAQEAWVAWCSGTPDGDGIADWWFGTFFILHNIWIYMG